MAKMRIKTGNGGNGKNRKVSFAAAAKASKDREQPADPEAPAEPAEDEQAALEAEEQTELSKLCQEETTVHIRGVNSDPFADSADARKKKRRSSASTIQVPVPGAPTGARKSAAGKTSARTRPSGKAGKVTGRQAPSGKTGAAKTGAAKAASSSVGKTGSAKATGEKGLKQVTPADVESMATMTRTRIRATDLPKRNTSPTVIFLGVVGWLYAVAMIAALSWVSGENEAVLEKVRKPLLEEKTKWEGKAAGELAKVDGEKKVLADELAKLESEHAQLTSENKGIEAEIAQFENKRNSIQTQMAQIQEDFMPTGEQAMTTGMNLSDVQKKFRDTMTLRGKIYGYYNKRWNELNKGFWACHKDPQAATMAAFFSANKHTPFAAAAAFFAAEKYYKSGWQNRAKSLYKTVQTDYGMSPYASLVPERLQQIEAKAAYKSGGYGKVHPFERYETEPITEHEKEQRKKRDEERAQRKAEEEAKKKAKGK